MLQGMVVGWYSRMATHTAAVRAVFEEEADIMREGSNSVSGALTAGWEQRMADMLVAPTSPSSPGSSAASSRAASPVRSPKTPNRRC